MLRRLLGGLRPPQPPRDLTRILSSQLWWLGDRLLGGGYRSTRTIEAVPDRGVRWEEGDPGKLAGIRQPPPECPRRPAEDNRGSSRTARDLRARDIHELLRTSRMQKRLRVLGTVKKPVTEREKQTTQRQRGADEAASLMCRHDREALYDRVWSHPAQEVAKEYEISGVRLGKVCRSLNIPVRPRCYWARMRSSIAIIKPALPSVK